MQPFQLIAHRGYCCRYPENTRLAFEAAVEAGAVALEADVQFSADGVPFIFHDRDLQRLCGTPGRLEQLRAEQVARLSAYAPEQFGRRYRGEGVLPLTELLALLAREPQLTLYLELKRISLRGFSVDEVLTRLWPLLWPYRERLVLISFSMAFLQAAAARGYPRIAPVLTHWSQLTRRSTRKLRPEAVFLNRRRLPFAACYPDLPYHLALYETSDLRQAMALVERGASLIETDDIGGMLQALAEL